MLKKKKGTSKNFLTVWSFRIGTFKAKGIFRDEKMWDVTQICHMNKKKLLCGKVHRIWKGKHWSETSDKKEIKNILSERLYFTESPIKTKNISVSSISSLFLTPKYLLKPTHCVLN